MHYFLQSDSNDDSNDDLFNENDFDFVTPPTPDTVPSQQNKCHQDASNPSWNDVDDAFQSNILFNPNNEPVGINHDIIDTLAEGTPYDFYSLFLDNDVIHLLVKETNRYAKSLLSTRISPKSRLHKWVDVTSNEMKTFLGIIMWMGLCPQPSIASYWKKSEIYASKIPKYMTRKRFEILLRSFHCCNNDDCPPGDRLFKISGLLDLLLSKYKMARTPEESMCIDESIVPFVGRLSFRQYIQNKRHRYGIKIFKLCIDNFYTVGFKIYAGKEAVVGQRLSTRIVTEMAEEYLDIGRTMYTDNWYSSYDLATELLKRSTHLVGTLRSNRKNNPTEVIKKKLKRGEVIAKQCNQGITILKWKDKRDVLAISTKHSALMVKTTNKFGSDIVKPKLILDYNKGKSLVDVCDLRNSYHNPLRRTLKWYKKIAFELLLNTSVLNALSLYEEITQKKISITSFREILIENLLEKKEEIPTENSHKLLETKSRGRCSNCYKHMVAQGGRKHAQSITRQIRTKCSSCKRFYCIQCFSEEHKIGKTK